MKKTVYDINIDDPKNLDVKIAKKKADEIMEWARMFYLASLVTVIGTIFVAIFASFNVWQVAMLYWFVLYLASNILRIYAKSILIAAIHNSLHNEK